MKHIGFGIYRPGKKKFDLIKPLKTTSLQAAIQSLRTARGSKKYKGINLVLCKLEEGGEFIKYGV